MTTKNVILITTFFILMGCGLRHKATLKVARQQAELFLTLLRQEQWDQASEKVILNKAFYSHHSLPQSTSDAEARHLIAKKFQLMYASVKPGTVHSLKLDSQDKTLLYVSYKHDDLDGFTMRLVDGTWYYSFE